MRLALRHYPPQPGPGRLKPGLLQTGQQAWRASWDAAFNKLVLTPNCPAANALAGRPDPPFRWQKTGARAYGLASCPKHLATIRDPSAAPPWRSWLCPVLAQPGASVASTSLPAPRDPRQMNAALGCCLCWGACFLCHQAMRGPCAGLGAKLSQSSERSRNPPMAPSVRRQVARSFERGHSRRCLATSSTNYR